MSPRCRCSFDYCRSPVEGLLVDDDGQPRRAVCEEHGRQAAEKGKWSHYSHGLDDVDGLDDEPDPDGPITDGGRADHDADREQRDVGSRDSSSSGVVDGDQDGDVRADLAARLARSGGGSGGE